MGRTIEIVMTTTKSSSYKVSVSVEGQAGFSIGTWLLFKGSVEGSASYDMSKVNGTSTECSVKITYKGYSIVPMEPAAWQQATNVGFYYPDPIWQANQNINKDVTGFHFLSTPPYNLGSFEEKGDFGLLTNLLIANYPTIEITYSNADIIYAVLA